MNTLEIIRALQGRTFEDEVQDYLGLDTMATKKAPRGWRSLLTPDMIEQLARIA